MLLLKKEKTQKAISKVLQEIKKKKHLYLKYKFAFFPVNRVLNTYQYRDQMSSEYLRKFIPPNGIEERLQNLECQLSLTTAVPKNIYKRLKMLEDRMLKLESISPEYIQFWVNMKYFIHYVYYFYSLFFRIRHLCLINPQRRKFSPYKK